MELWHLQIDLIIAHTFLHSSKKGYACKPYSFMVLLLEQKKKNLKQKKNCIFRT